MLFLKDTNWRTLTNLGLKKSLHQACVAHVTHRIENAQQAMNAAQQAANKESKSTAGDKHDTARAMMHLEKEKAAKQMAEALKLKQVLDGISPDQQLDKVQLGSLVTASNGLFYLSVGVGKIEVEGKVCFVLSPAAPVGQLLMNKVVGDQVQFNGKAIEILAIC